MNRNVCLVVILAASSFFCGEKNMAETDSLGMVERAISLCVSEYSRLSDEAFFSEVDKAYVHVSSNLFGVIFARGEVGTFGERSKDYRAYLSCGVDASDGLKIFSLVSPMSDPLIELPESESIDHDFYKGNVKELLYKRSGDQFIFVVSQDFEEPD